MNETACEAFCDSSHGICEIENARPVCRCHFDWLGKEDCSVSTSWRWEGAEIPLIVVRFLIRDSFLFSASSFGPTCFVFLHPLQFFLCLRLFVHQIGFLWSLIAGVIFILEIVQDTARKKLLSWDCVAKILSLIFLLRTYSHCYDSPHTHSSRLSLLRSCHKCESAGEAPSPLRLLVVLY